MSMNDKSSFIKSLNGRKMQPTQHSPQPTSNHRSIDSSQDLHGVVVLLLMLEAIQSQYFGLGGQD